MINYLICFLLTFLASAQTINLRTGGLILGMGLQEHPRLPGDPMVASVDLGLVSYRVAPPTAPGKCSPHGSGVWAADRQYLYVCVVNTANTDFEWARVPLATW